MYVLLKLRTRGAEDRQLGEVEYQSMEEAYLDVCASIPDLVADQMRKRQNPFLCSFIISDESGMEMMEVPFSELLPSDSVDQPSTIASTSQEDYSANINDLFSLITLTRYKIKIIQEDANKRLNQMRRIKEISENITV